LGILFLFFKEKISTNTAEIRTVASQYPANSGDKDGLVWKIERKLAKL
jgi:hypothetical protein